MKLLAERIEACYRMECLYRAERKGLMRARQRKPLIIQYRADPEKQARFALGYREGLELLDVEASA